MDKSQIVETVLSAVRQVQEVSGRPLGEIDSRTRPIGDVEGFDSLSGIDAIVILSESLGYDLPDDRNPFISKDRRRALSVSEMADNLLEILGTGESKSK